MNQVEVAIWLMISAFAVMILGYRMPVVRTLFVSIGFFTMMSAAFANYSNWLPQVRGVVPEETVIEGDFTQMAVEDLAALGEKIIFGDGGMKSHGQGKGQCPLCHAFEVGALGERAPNLIGISARAGERIKDERFKTAKTSQSESYSGSGRAASGIEYIAESHTCPSCYVVAGYGVKGSNDGESPMPAIHKAPIELSLAELVAVDVWMYYREGEDPPPASEIKAAYEKFIPADHPSRAAGKPKKKEKITGIDPKKLALKDDTPEQIIKKMVCYACHRIPGIEYAKTGAVGPLLIEGSSAKRRIKSAEYRAAVKAGKAHATTPKEYIMESIVMPSAFIVPGFIAPAGRSLMPPNFADKMTYTALSNLADYLLAQDEAAALKDGLDRLPQEKEGSLKKAALLEGQKDMRSAQSSESEGNDSNL